MTIEERAKFYEPDAFDADEIFPAREGHIVNRIRNAYIAGATEQKSVDIMKAREWLGEHAKEYFSPGMCPYGGCGVAYERLTEDFKKYMEG